MIAASVSSLGHLLILGKDCGLDLVQVEGFYWEMRNKQRF